MGNMFYNCSALTELDLSGFNLKSLTNYQEMLAGCEALKFIKTPYSTGDTKISIDLPSEFYLFNNSNGTMLSTNAYESISNDTSVCNPVSMANASGSGMALSKRYAILK